MALPTILIDSATGSDTAASGAGPGTALTGTDGSFVGAVVTVPNKDLSGVATDGSHVLYLLTSTGVRFFKITGSASSGTPSANVTVTPSPAGTSTGRTYAIGGKRASLTSSSSILLVDNGGAAGDAKAGWIIEMQSGHAETYGAALDVRSGGDSTDGVFTIRGAGASIPTITFSADTIGFVVRGSGVHLEFIKAVSSSTKTTGSAFNTTVGVGTTLKKCVATTSGSNKWAVGAVIQNGEIVSECEFAGSTYGIQSNAGGSTPGTKIDGCYIHDTTSHGIYYPSNPFFGVSIRWCIFDTCGGDGINFNNSRPDAFGCATMFSNNIFYNNSSDGLEIANNTDSNICLLIESNIFMSNSVYGINFSHASSTAAYLALKRVVVRNNDFYTNGTGKYNPTGLTSNDEATTDPGFTDAPNGDFRIGTNLKALGYPTGKIGAYGNNQSYVDIGAMQRQELGGLPPRLMQIHGGNRSEY